MSHVDTEADELVGEIESARTLYFDPVLVYIAGPYTKPDPCVNTHAAIRAADDLLLYGFVPFVPHLTHLWHTMSPKAYQFWLDYDLVWLAKCDALLRLPGESAGADAEVIRAGELGIPVFHTIEELTAWEWT